MHTIALVPEQPYRRDQYGVLLVSETVHTILGRGVHNRGFAHEIAVWENRPSKARDADPSVLVTPHGQPTEERYTILTSAQATVISATRDPNEREHGEALAIGEIVELTIHGYAIGQFTITAGNLRDPHLVPVTA